MLTGVFIGIALVLLFTTLFAAGKALEYHGSAEDYKAKAERYEGYYDKARSDAGDRREYTQFEMELEKSREVVENQLDLEAGLAEIRLQELDATNRISEKALKRMRKEAAKATVVLEEAQSALYGPGSTPDGDLFPYLPIGSFVSYGVPIEGCDCDACNPPVEQPETTPTPEPAEAPAES
jgi:hypothetical protein